MIRYDLCAPVDLHMCKRHVIRNFFYFTNDTVLLNYVVNYMYVSRYADIIINHNNRPSDKLRIPIKYMTFYTLMIGCVTHPFQFEMLRVRKLNFNTT